MLPVEMLETARQMPPEPNAVGGQLFVTTDSTVPLGSAMIWMEETVSRPLPALKM